MNKRVYNFSAGPAVMPEPVLQQAAQELLCHGDDGMSVMEMSHRSSMFTKIFDEAEANLRALMHIPDNYKVLFLQGGASLQFSMIPLNLMRSGHADYINTGSWSKKAIKEAKKVGEVNIVASSEEQNFSELPQIDAAKMNPDADYLYIVTNNTIYGTCYPELPKPPAGVPLVADASSNILSRPYDINDFGLLYFGAQKNVGPAGLTIVIVREDLVGHCPANTPTMLDYKTHVDNGSMFNTPPTFAIYMAGLVFKWMLENGGVEAMWETNKKKAALLYDYIDQSGFYKGTVTNKAHRSIMNVPFVLPDEGLNKPFLEQAEARGLVNLKGHRSVGGMRASIYNAMPVEGVQTLVDFMREFAQNHR